MKNSGSTIILGANDCKQNRSLNSKSLPPSCRYSEETRVKPYYTGKNKADQKQTQSTTADKHEGKKKDEDKKNKIRMPQRKGGLQLWQFLYALLEDKNEQHSELIEWTQNRKDLEFRLNDPETIAYWWGIIKHRANMTYERLSRSLRYYYDRGILKKMGGERYLYRFCIDPEEMYRHIGLSDSRPILKPMPLLVNKCKSLMSHHPPHMDPTAASYYPDYLTQTLNMPPLHPSQLPPPPPYPGYHFQSPTAGPTSFQGGSCALDFYPPTEDGAGMVTVADDQNGGYVFGQHPHLSEQSYSFNTPLHNSYNMPISTQQHESSLPFSSATLATVGSLNSSAPIFSYGQQQIPTSSPKQSLSAIDVPSLSDSDSDCPRQAQSSICQLPMKYPSRTTNDVIHRQLSSPTATSEPPSVPIYSQSMQQQFIDPCNSSPTSTSSELDEIIPLLESMEEESDYGSSSNTGRGSQQATSSHNNNTSPIGNTCSPPCYTSDNKRTLESSSYARDISTSSISSQSKSFVYSSCSITQMPTVPTTSSDLCNNNSFRSSSWIGEDKNIW